MSEEIKAEQAHRIRGWSEAYRLAALAGYEQQRREDVQADLTATQAENARLKRQIEALRAAHCFTCDGTKRTLCGCMKFADPKLDGCDNCDGTGYVPCCHCQDS